MKRLFTFVLMVGLASPVLATHNHPSRAKQLKVTFVTAYNNCAAPNTTHKVPLAFPGCTSPVPTTNNNPTNQMTFGPHGALTAKLKVGNGDIAFKLKGKDILDNGAPFSGNLTWKASIRWTDHGCGASLTTPCTVFDFNFPIPVTCLAGSCDANTNFNTLIPGGFSPGDESNIEVGQMFVEDPDGDTAFRQGLFIP